MYSIKNNIDNTIIIKKSKFITKLYKISSVDDVNNIINNLRNEYKDSTHICYAYIINGMEKCVDDGEPSGTAGLPILNVIKKNSLNYILAVVIRYFGGIKLGAGGLVRAYSNSITNTLNLVDIVDLIEGFNIIISFTYDNIKYIDKLLNNIEIIEKQYNDLINYNFNIEKKTYENIKEVLIEKCNNIIINKKIYITK